MAATAINLAGGIDIGGTDYFIGIVIEDTKEAFYDNDAAIAAAIKMISYDPDYCIGGFRSETFQVYIHSQNARIQSFHHLLGSNAMQG